MLAGSVGTNHWPWAPKKNLRYFSRSRKRTSSWQSSWNSRSKSSSSSSRNRYSQFTRESQQRKFKAQPWIRTSHPLAPRSWPIAISIWFRWNWIRRFSSRSSWKKIWGWKSKRKIWWSDSRCFSLIWINRNSKNHRGSLSILSSSMLSLTTCSSQRMMSLLMIRRGPENPIYTINQQNSPAGTQNKICLPR